MTVTRHVAPNSDVRPLLFLKHFDFERDARFSKEIEDCLRKGDWETYRGIVFGEQATSRKALALEKTLITVRQWLAADRQIVMSNSAPLIVKAAILVPEQRHLNVLAVQVLERIAEKLSAEDFAKVVDIKDTLALDPRVSTPQKNKILDKVIELFRPDLEANNDRESLWLALLEKQEQLTVQQKARIATWIASRISINEGEGPVLRLLSTAEANSLNVDWLLEDSLLQQLIQRVDFSGISPDPIRIKVLTSAQSQLSSDSFGALVRKIAKVVESADESGLAQHGISAFLQLDPKKLSGDDVGVLFDELLKHLSEDHISKGSIWLKALLHLHGSLSEKQQTEFDTIVVADFSQLEDPDAFVDGLRELSLGERAELLSFPRVRSAMRSQAEALESSWELDVATEARTKIIDCFDPLQVSSVDLFDEKLEWDLLILVNAIKKAAATDRIGPEQPRKILTAFCKQFLLPQLPQANKVYDHICESVNDQPDLVSEELAATMCPATLDLFDQNLRSYYRWFQFWRRALPSEQSPELIRSVADRFLRSKATSDRIPILRLLSDDIVDDTNLRENQQVVKEVFDYAFEDADKEPVKGTKVVLDLMPFLADAHLRDYIDRALDTLITYEAAREPLERMEPFFSMLETPAAKLSEGDLYKIAKICRRMLGAANTEEEQIRALGIVDHLKRPELVGQIRGELEQLANSDIAGVAELAKSLLQQLQQEN